MFVYPKQKPVETHSFCGEYNEMGEGSLSFHLTHSCNYVLFLSMHTVFLDKYVYKHTPRL